MSKQAKILLSAGIAQLVEQLIPNQQVLGSSPSAPAILTHLNALRWVFLWLLDAWNCEDVGQDSFKLFGVELRCFIG